MSQMFVELKVHLNVMLIIAGEFCFFSPLPFHFPCGADELKLGY